MAWSASKGWATPSGWQSQVAPPAPPTPVAAAQYMVGNTFMNSTGARQYAVTQAFGIIFVNAR